MRGLLKENYYIAKANIHLFWKFYFGNALGMTYNNREPVKLKRDSDYQLPIKNY